jgi:hypothetical protein
LGPVFYNFLAWNSKKKDLGPVFYYSLAWYSKEKKFGPNILLFFSLVF